MEKFVTREPKSNDQPPLVVATVESEMTSAIEDGDAPNSEGPSSNSSGSKAADVDNCAGPFAYVNDLFIYKGKDNKKVRHSCINVGYVFQK